MKTQTTTPEYHFITIGWTETHPSTKTVERFACTWVQKGTNVDVVRARRFIDDQYPTTGAVFTYPTGVKHPLKDTRAALQG